MCESLIEFNSYSRRSLRVRARIPAAAPGTRFPGEECVEV